MSFKKGHELKKKLPSYGPSGGWRGSSVDKLLVFKYRFLEPMLKQDTSVHDCNPKPGLRQTDSGDLLDGHLR